MRAFTFFLTTAIATMAIAGPRSDPGSDLGALGELIRAVRREEGPENRRRMAIALGRIGDHRAIWDLMRLIDEPGGAALWSIRTILDGSPPCLPDDTEALGLLDRLRGEKTRAWWRDLTGKDHYRPDAILLQTAGDEDALLRDLRSDDERIALRAAERLRPSRLTLAELRIQAALLARHPRSWALQALGRPLGTVDFPILWPRLSASGLTVEDTQGRTHWAVRPDAIPVLTALLPEANAEWFREFSSLLAWVARDTDRFRLDAARGFAYVLARLECEKAGEPPPALSEIRVALPGPGLPPAFVALVRSRLLTVRPGSVSPEDVASWIPPLPWLRGWARELRPASGDLPFLLEIARGAEDLLDCVWSVQAIGRIEDAAATPRLVEFAAAEDDLSAFAAAELARDGMPERFREILASRSEDDLVTMLAFDVMPEVAVKLWLERVVRPVPEDDWGMGVFDPGAEADAERSAEYGVRLRPREREALAKAFPVERVTIERMAWFLTEVSASPLDDSRLGAVVSRLREHEFEEDADLDSMGMRALLALIEVRARDELVRLLHHWVEHREGNQRVTALTLLAKLGDARFVPEMIEIWPEEDAFFVDAYRLGRVKAPRVEAFLLERARSDDPARYQPALSALAIQRGLPEDLAVEFDATMLDPETSEAFVAARRLLLEGDALGAVLLVIEASPGNAVPALGTVDDPRALAALRKYRAGREHRWEAVAGLVLAGDEDARRELAGLLEDGRTWIFYPVASGRVFTFDLDPRWMEFWLDRIDATCCIGFSALESLGEMFPTLHLSGIVHRPQFKSLIVDWWRAHGDHLAYSRILDGWVPTR